MKRWFPISAAGRLTVAVALVVLGFAFEASAHHSTAYYSKDQKDFLKVEGKVVRFEFRSPHSQLYVETPDKDGKLVTWRFETTPAAWLLREGFKKESLAVGETISVEGFPIPGTLYAWLGKVTKQDGTKLLPQRSSATPEWWKP